MVKPRDVSVSVHESNGALKVNVSFTIPGAISREWAQGVDPPRFLRVDEKDRKIIQKQIAKELSQIELFSVDREPEFTNPVSVHISGQQALLKIDKHKETYNKAESWMMAHLPSETEGAYSFALKCCEAIGINLNDGWIPTWVVELAGKTLNNR